MSQNNSIIKKPWGYEYLAYRNERVALWVLHIDHDQKTSMHCHPNKSTGLVVVGGVAGINFISDSKRIVAPGKQMIRRGLFHQTTGLAPDGVIMLEIETPVDKGDLVRLHDSYGRSGEGYEGSEAESPLRDDCVIFDDPVGDQKHYYKLGSSKLTVERLPIDKKGVFDNRKESDIIMFLNGGLVKTVGDRCHLVTAPGDVGTVQVIKQVAAEMDGFADNTIIVSIR